MRKNALAMSIAALAGGLGFVGAASADVVVGTSTPTSTTLGATTATALAVANGGIGHSLITPYFNAQNGNATIISVTNTDTLNGKIMKVRFRGASNSDDIFDFTVLMSPGDVWNATISSTGGGAAQLVTSDRTCTLPQLTAGQPQSFVTTRLTNKSSNDLNNHTREGYIEIFNMADVPNLSVYGGSANAQSALYTTIKHVGGVPPCTGSVINTAIFTTNHVAENTAAAQGLATPTTGLFGNWVIINVPQTTTYSGEMVAVRATIGAGGLDGRANFVVFPQSATAYPGVINNVTADPLLRTVAFATKSSVGVTGGATSAAAIAAAFYDLPDMSTPYVGPAAASTDPEAQANVLTAALAVTSIMNEYANDSAITARTDWVFSMPTRRYSVAMDYAPTTSRRLYTAVPSGAVAQYFHDGNTAINTLNAQQICVNATSQAFYDREEATKTSGAVFSPGSVSVTQFCGETSVLSFADPLPGNSVLSATVARQDTGSSGFTNGWGNVNVLGANGLGLPILGGSFIKATNPLVAAGQSGTYGITSEHRFTR